MNNHPQLHEVPDDHNEPATKGDLAILRQEMSAMKDEILRHFDVVAENIHRDVAGANQDKVQLIENKQDDHEERLTTIEQRVGLR